MSAAPKLEAPRERPILFSGPMVRAILEGRKTQTRRVVKQRRTVAEGIERLARGERSADVYGPCPYGQPGDRLWVRETWSLPPGHYDLMTPREVPQNVPVRYAADGVVRGVSKRFVDGEGRFVTGQLRPSIFMPRWACRLVLEVTEVRVQRLRDITAEDCVAEGIRELPLPEGQPGAWWGASGKSWRGPRRAFEALWDSINGERPGCSWSANPWVWCVSFRRAA